jgi:hypothetical protein
MPWNSALLIGIDGGPPSFINRVHAVYTQRLPIGLQLKYLLHKFNNFNPQLKSSNLAAPTIVLACAA